MPNKISIYDFMSFIVELNFNEALSMLASLDNIDDKVCINASDMEYFYYYDFNNKCIARKKFFLTLNDRISLENCNITEELECG